MTAAGAAQEAGETVDESLSKADASRKIDELQERTGRGRPAKSWPGRRPQ